VNITAFIAIALLGILTFVGITTHKKSVKTNTGVNFSATPTQKPSITLTPSAENNNEEKTPPNTPAPTAAGNFNSNLQLSDFTYPNSSLVSKSGNSQTLQSSDDPQSVSSWYQNRINGLRMGAKSTINTTTNGNTNDVIDAAGGGIEVKINITKSSGDLNTTINVTLSQNNANSVNSNVNNTQTNSVQGSNSTTINNNIHSYSDSSNSY